MSYNLESGIFAKKPWDSESCTEIWLVLGPSTSSDLSETCNTTVGQAKVLPDINRFQLATLATLICAENQRVSGSPRTSQGILLWCNYSIISYVKYLNVRMIT